MSNHTRRRKTKANLPPKPTKDFPLTPHPLGYWCKSINGKIRYFGRWGRQVNGKMERIPGDGWQAALDKYLAEKDDLLAGREPRPKQPEGLQVKGLCNAYLTTKKALLDAGEITPRTFVGYTMVTNRLVKVLGEKLVDAISTNDLGRLRADMAETLGPVALANNIQGVRSVFKFAFDEGLLEKPIRFGQQFKKPSKKTLRKERVAKGKRMFEAEQLKTLIDAAPLPLKAMILLAINCGFGNTDVATLPLSAVNLETGWVEFPRVKTGIERRCPLWPETIDAIREALDARPKHKLPEDADLIFVTRKGNRWVKSLVGSSDDSVAKETAKLLKELGLHRAGLGFYACRHTFQTIGEEAGETATKHVMGHVDDSMSAVYREKISDERLRAVTDHVRNWLWPPEPEQKENEPVEQKADSEPVQLRIVG